MTPSTPTLDNLLGWLPHVLALVKMQKNTHMNFPCHTESVSQHVDHFKPVNFLKRKFWKKLSYFPTVGGEGGGTPSRKIPQK